MSKSTALNNPKTIGFGIGAIIKPSKFYSAKSVVINSIWGEAIIAASDDLVMSSISRLVMPEDFNLDLSMAQDIAIFGRKAVIVGSDNSHDKLTEENKMLREALNHQYMHNILDWAICGISTNSASGTIGRAERMNKFNEFKIALNKAIGACE